jgi:hypothetical protein
MMENLPVGTPHWEKSPQMAECFGFTAYTVIAGSVGFQMVRCTRYVIQSNGKLKEYRVETVKGVVVCASSDPFSGSARWRFVSCVKHEQKSLFMLRIKPLLHFWVGTIGRP